MRKQPKPDRLSKFTQFLLGTKLLTDLVKAGYWCWEKWQ